MIFYWCQTLRKCIVLRLPLVQRWQEHASLWAPPKDKILVKNYEDKQLQTKNKHHSGMLTPPITWYCPCSMSGRTDHYSDGKRKLKCYNGREKVFDLYKLGENLLTGADLETYQQILQDQKSFLRSCDSICLISVPCMLPQVLREPWLLRPPLDSRNKLLWLPRLDWSTSGWTEARAGTLHVVPPKGGLGSGLIPDWRDPLGTTFSPGQFLHHSTERQP